MFEKEEEEEERIIVNFDINVNVLMWYADNGIMIV